MDRCLASHRTAAKAASDSNFSLLPSRRCGGGHARTPAYISFSPARNYFPGVDSGRPLAELERGSQRTLTEQAAREGGVGDRARMPRRKRIWTGRADAPEKKSSARFGHGFGRREA